MDVPVRFIDSIINNPLLMQFLVHRWFFLLEYDPRLDQLRVYDTRSRTLETLDAYLGSEKPEHATVFAEDRWKMRALHAGGRRPCGGTRPHHGCARGGAHHL